jgi:signal transduction histidine kinase
VRVYGNAGLLQQLMTNLLLNACNALGSKGGEVAIALTVEGDHAVLTITDTGRGIPPDHLTNVFDPFFTTMPVGQGTGLGLTICYAIVQHHEGTIELASQPGEGTTVSVRLPLDDVSSRE